MRIRTAFPLLASLALTACGGSDSTGPGPASNTMTAQVDGAAWTAATRGATYVNGVLTITGTNAAQLLVTIGVSNVTGPGTFSLAGGNQNGALGNVINGAAIWASSLAGGSGTITVTSLTATAVTGTFSFTAVPATASATGTRQVTSGQFNLPL
jgi:Family of unknown function (DUF6252)